MNQMQEALIGALVGLARSLDDSNIRPESLAVIAHALDCLAQGKGLEDALAGVRAEKSHAVPDCAVCRNPCGRTLDLTGQEIQALDEKRRELLETLIRLGGQGPVPGADYRPRLELLLRGLYALGYPWFSPEELEEILQNVQSL